MDSPGGGGSGCGGDEDGIHRLYCDNCGATVSFQSGDDGFYYCIDCGSMSQDVVDSGDAAEDILPSACGASGGLYSIRHHRARPNTIHIPSSPDHLKPDPEAGAPAFADPDEPRDFSSGPWPEMEELVVSVRTRYVQGLQVMLQMQLEVLVERFHVSPLICGVAGEIWLRYAAKVGVFEKRWVDEAVAAAKDKAAAACKEAAGAKKRTKNAKPKPASIDDESIGRITALMFLRVLKKKIPLHTTLAISFLSCHIARETVLPTDIYGWALDGKLPYLAAFVELDKHLGRPPKSCPLSSRIIFRPWLVVGTWQIESAAGLIAQSIGLRLPSVNFYALAHRCLKDLCLPVDKILPLACRVYEWSMPAELWLSSNAVRLPTQVCMMSILIVTLRILYKIHGKGVWEESLSEESSYEEKVIGKWTAGYDAEELLTHLEAVYEKIDVCYDHEKDLNSLFKYCKDVIFPGTTLTFEEETLVKIFSDYYEEDDKQADLKSHSQGLSGTGFTDGMLTSPRNEFVGPIGEQSFSAYSIDSSSFDGYDVKGATKPIHKGNPVKLGCICPKGLRCVCFSLSSRNAEVTRMKLDMEANGFSYLPPRTNARSDGYLHYRRKKIDGVLVYAVHADYYIVVRAFARLAQVDGRLMHIAVMKLERKLAWLEKRIEGSLVTLHSIGGSASDKPGEVSG